MWRRVSVPKNPASAVNTPGQHGLGPLFNAVSCATCHVKSHAFAGDPGPGGYLFCFWNVENLFDDRVTAQPAEVCEHIPRNDDRNRVAVFEKSVSDTHRQLPLRRVPR